MIIRRGRARIPGHPARAVVGAFLAAILAGAGLLCIPAASHAPGSPPFEAALFTATSAVTVTGLATVDTATFWTPFGQLVILVLIQLGGLGIVTSASLLILVASDRLGLRRRLAAQAETQAMPVHDIRRVIVTIVVLSAAFEAVATAVLTTDLWLRGQPFATALWEGAFHAVSAFNNAGFSLYSDGLVGVAADAWFLATVAVAVIAGGLGFPVWMDLARRPREPGRWSLHTKLTLATTAALLVIGTVVLTAIEWGNERTLGAMPASERLLNGVFAGVTPRTAGFNSIDYGEADPSALLVTDMLMFAGGGSGSTAGGLKVTTLAILFLVVWAELRGDREPSAFGRRIPVVSARQALTVAVLSINLVVLATVALMLTNGLELSAALFEAVSAFATVGLSTGVTPDLDLAGQFILMPLMLIGRVGPVTLFVALVLRERRLLYSRPEERPLVG
ncbi:TrkH family potassium uptake protein [Miltoncostaea marina]|uniref:TrkH family potassium uptake protein n=1 Tax=Miltoncostaea marina TaxID=2843215 RepID=UPI001C3E4DD8|nr:potassium transporter TrkG [Miltoncostaea marina]